MNGAACIILAVTAAALFAVIWRDVEAWFRGDA